MSSDRSMSSLVSAVHTPFRADGSLAPEVVATQAAFLAANGIRTVFVTGTTGECHSLTHDERRAMFDAWAEASPAHGMRVMAHVGGNVLEEARALARHAAARGLSAISALAPSYYRPATMDALVEWCAAIAAEAPDLPFYYYDIPSMTGVTLPIDRFLREAGARIPTLAVLKFTNLDLVSYRRSLDVAAGRYDLPWGTDEALLGALATGARGAVGSTYNWAPALYAGLMDAFARGDLAEAQQRQSTAVAMIDALSSVGFMGAAKALMTHLGVPVGPARAPLGNPSPSAIDALLQRLDALGFESWGARPVS